MFKSVNFNIFDHGLEHIVYGRDTVKRADTNPNEFPVREVGAIPKPASVFWEHPFVSKCIRQNEEVRRFESHGMIRIAS